MPGETSQQPTSISQLTFSNPASVPEPMGQFSQAVLVKAPASFLFISGQVPRASDGSTIGKGSMAAQAECVFDRLAKILEVHGSSFSQVIKTTTFVTDMTRVEEMIAVRKRFYGDAAPASTLVQVSQLGDPDWLLEIELIALCR